MKVGHVLSGLAPWRHVEAGVRTAEAIHADSLWMADHLLGFFHPRLWPDLPVSKAVPDSDAYFDPFSAGAVIGGMTGIPFGIGVTDATRRGPADVARAALTLQHLAKGGFNLGIGAGEAESLLPFGYPQDRPVERTERFLEVLTALLDTGRVPDRDGRLALPRRSAAGRVRLWLAAHGPRMLQLTGRYADGWIPAFGMTPDEYAERRAVIARHAAAAGRPAPEYGLFASFILGESRDRLREQFEAAPLAKLLALVAPGRVWRKYGLEHPSGPESRGVVDVIVRRLDPEMLRELAPRIPFELLEDGAFIGNVAEVTARLRAYAERGCAHVMLQSIGGYAGELREPAVRHRDLLALREALGAIEPGA